MQALRGRVGQFRDICAKAGQEGKPVNYYALSQ
jgi:hypothetical protein